MKGPFETVTETFFENLDRLKENQRYNFSNSEKFMIWIVGFSIGGLFIIVSNLTQFNQSFSHNILKTILILLSISIISGIVYRWAFYLFQIQYPFVSASVRLCYKPEIGRYRAQEIFCVPDSYRAKGLIELNFVNLMNGTSGCLRQQRG